MRILKRAFTLVELLVVIAIIGILTAIIVPNFMGARERADDSKIKQDMMAIKNALRTYYNDNQSYPPETNWSSLVAPYIPSVTDFSIYTYNQGPSGESFTLGAEMEATVAQDLQNSWSSCGISEPATQKTYYVCAN